MIIRQAIKQLLFQKRWHSSYSRDPTAYSWLQSSLVSQAPVNHDSEELESDDSIAKHPFDLLIMQDVITEEEEKLLAEQCTKALRRRRYENGHWDDAIVRFRELERITEQWSDDAAKIIERVRREVILPDDREYLPASHIIDLAPDGYIKPHVDSIKFSGDIVAGLSILSPSIMRFKHESSSDASIIDALLPRRSMYAMSGAIRYHYTHEILPGEQDFRGQEVKRNRRISIMFRDVKL